MYSDAGESAVAVTPADAVQLSAEQPAAVDAVLYNSNTTSVPSCQYDSSGMTELSLVTDEVYYCELRLSECSVFVRPALGCGVMHSTHEKDGRLLATSFASLHDKRTSKSRDTITRPHFKNPARSNLDIVP